MDLLQNLNINQKTAVMHGKGPQLVLGGAGTGKTLVIANRIAYLIRERNIVPKNILAVTSTDMAAKRMSEQVQNFLGDNDVPLITTFQALCTSILRREIGRLGFGSNFAIYDKLESELLLKEILELENIDDEKYPAKAFACAIAECKDAGNSPEDLATKDPVERLLVRVYHAYQECLKKCNALDYGDTAIQAERLLTDFPDVRCYYQERFPWILIDNYEDITPAQFQLIPLLLGEYKNLCVASDDDQSIYRQRSADIRKILDFERDFPGAVVVNLEQNYRSIEESLNGQAPAPDHDGDGSFFGFSVGARVQHATFGVGTIRRFEGSGEDARAIVFFDSLGPKKLLLRIAGLEMGPRTLDLFSGYGLVEDVKNVPPVIPEPIIYPCPACKTMNRIPVGKDPAMFTCGACHATLEPDVPSPDSDSSQHINFNGSRLNYLYFRRAIKPPSEIISALSDEQLYLRVHGKSMSENNSAVVEVRRIQQSAGNDNLMLLQCLSGRALTPSEIDEKWKAGYVSKAEQRLYQMLKALADTNWNIYHQVDVGGLINPIDIVAVTANFQIYAIELDGPHHLLSSQRANDDQRDTLLLNQGFNIIRVGYEKYALSCAQAAQEILLVLRGQVKPENTWRPDVRVDIDESDNASNSKHPDFYRNRQQTEPSSNCEPPAELPHRYCYIYCQSTGIGEKSQIVDFCLLVEEGEVRKQYYSKVKPSCPIESKATALHGFSDNDVNDCPTLHSYLEQHSLKKILEDSDSLVVTYDWDFMGRVIRNTALRYLNWQNINLYSVVDTVRLKHGLKPISTISESVAALNISPSKYKRYDSKEYARLIREMFLDVTSSATTSRQTVNSDV